MEKQSGAATPARELPQDLFNLRVLVVHDNATNRQILRHQIFAWKRQKGSAAGGHEALKIFRAAVAAGLPYDVALLDMQMPEMDGYEATRTVRLPRGRYRQPCRWHAPARIIAMTANAMQGGREKCLAAGMDDYISKPMRLAELQAVLDRWRAVVQPGAKAEAV